MCGIAASRFCLFITALQEAGEAMWNFKIMSSEELWVIVILIVVFYLCRELNCWYLKINDRKKQMDQMIENQKEIIELLKKERTISTQNEEN